MVALPGNVHIWSAFFCSFVSSKIADGSIFGMRACERAPLGRLTFLGGHVDIEVEAILTLVSEVGRCYIQVSREPGRHHVSQYAPLVQRLRTHGGKLCHIAYSGPRQRWLRGLETPVPSGRPCVWYSQVLDDGPQQV